jgi:hypothetical protein
VTYQITLTPDEYAALSAAAAREGKTVEEMVHAALKACYPPASQSVTQSQMSPLVAYMYRVGHIASLPSGEPDTPEEEAELDELVKRVGPGKAASEMVIEDRGPC